MMRNSTSYTFHMSPFRIRPLPEELHCSISNLWNGTAADQSLHAGVWISQSVRGILVRVHSKIHPSSQSPTAPAGSRVDGLWQYNVVELFLVGVNDQYLEIELSESGHWLVLGFESVRKRSHAYEDFIPEFTHSIDANYGTWESSILIPWSIIPENLSRMNAFSIIEGQYLALNSVPGLEPDFHQPSTYPLVILTP